MALLGGADPHAGAVAGARVQLQVATARGWVGAGSVTTGRNGHSTAALRFGGNTRVRAIAAGTVSREMLVRVNAPAAARLGTARPLLQAKAEELNLPLENLLTPDYLRRVAWRPPAEVTEDSISVELRALGAREWQVDLAAPLIAGAFLNPQPLPPKEAKPVAATGGQ